MKKKILILSGTRAEYGYIKRILKLMERSTKLEYCLLVSGTHLDKEFGASIKEIKQDKIEKFIQVRINAIPKDPSEWSKNIGKSIVKISNTIKKIDPDLILIPGDPWIIFATAIASTYMRIPIAHIQGGELSGNVDGIVRHAIAKLAHIHFVSNKNAKKVVKQLGEEEFRIFNVGGSMMDEVIYGEKIDKHILLKELNFDIKKPIIIVLQHPVSLEYKLAKQQIEKTLSAVKKTNLQTIVIYPNSEPGSKNMINCIKKYKKEKNFRIFQNIPRKKFLSLLKIVDIIIGNSSSGIIEAPALRLPVINIGTRQKERLRAKNVIDVNYNEKEIFKTIKKILSDKKLKDTMKQCSSPYGNGKSSEKIVKILEELKIDDKLLNKKFCLH